MPDKVAKKGTQMGNTQLKKLHRQHMAGKVLLPSQRKALIDAGLALKGDFK